MQEWILLRSSTSEFKIRLPVQRGNVRHENLVLLMRSYI
jgi:hypothetical protein